MTPDEAEDFWAEDEPNLATQGHAFSAGHHEAGSLLLEMIQAAIRLHILLTECEEAEFRVLRPRLQAFLDCADNLPREASPQRRGGFRPPPKRVKRKRRS